MSIYHPIAPPNDLKIPKEVLTQWQGIVEAMAQVLAVPTALITRVAAPEIEVLRASETAENPYAAGQRVNLLNHYCEAVVKEQAPVIVPDARTSDRWNNAPELAHGMVAYLGFPIRWPSGAVFGTLCAQDNKANAYSGAHQAVLQQFTSLVETHLALLIKQRELTQQRDALRRQVEENRQLRGIIPICARCKKVRDDQDYWIQVEDYIRKHSEANFSHGYCPECEATVLAQ